MLQRFKIKIVALLPLLAAVSPAEARVRCGRHFANDCSMCTRGYGDQGCGGECKLFHGHCVSSSANTRELQKKSQQAASQQNERSAKNAKERDLKIQQAVFERQKRARAEEKKKRAQQAQKPKPPPSSDGKKSQEKLTNVLEDRWQQREFSQYNGGHLAKGDDLVMEELTVEEAKARCAHLPECHGFTFEGPVTKGRVPIFFKSAWHFDPGSHWTSFQYHPARPDLHWSKPAVLGGVNIVKDEDEELQKDETQALPPPRRRSFKMPKLKLVPFVVVIVLVLLGLNFATVKKMVLKEMRNTVLPLDPVAGKSKNSGKSCQFFTIGEEADEILKADAAAAKKPCQFFNMCDEDEAVQPMCLSNETPKGLTNRSPTSTNLEDDGTSFFI